jgi:hypothetical protein
MAKALDNVTYIDKRFYNPPFVIDVRSAGEEDSFGDYAAGGGGGGEPAPDLPGTGEGKVISPPTSYTIINQTVRISADGSSVVDVTMEFPDATGIVAVDVRITKV